MSFATLGLHPKLEKSLTFLGYTSPTTVQSQVIPLALSGKDIIGQSETGSGKTAAFALPILQQITRKEGLQALILTPTRELCLQVTDSFKKYGKKLRIGARPIYGGVGYYPQIQALKTSEIVVATPGRLLDLIRGGHVDFSHLKLFVLDEVDVMLDMGFIDDVRTIARRIPSKPQTLLFSATLPPKVGTLISEVLKDPTTIQISKKITRANLEEQYYLVDKGSKLSLLVHLLKESKANAIVFTATRSETEFLQKNLGNNGVESEVYHGGMTQSKRESVVQQLNQGQINVVIATNIASRGLDIRRVNHIINWDLPADATDYTHRIGRTGRAGDVGYAITLVTQDKARTFKLIQKKQKNTIIQMQVPKMKNVRMDRSRSGNEEERPRRKENSRRSDTPRAVFQKKRRPTTKSSFYSKGKKRPTHR